MGEAIRQVKRKKDGTIITTDLESSTAAMSVKDETVKKWAIEDNEIGQFMNATSMLHAGNRDGKFGDTDYCNGAKIEIPFFNFYFLNFVFLYLSILTIYHLYIPVL